MSYRIVDSVVWFHMVKLCVQLGMRLNKQMVKNERCQCLKSLILYKMCNLDDILEIHINKIVLQSFHDDNAGGTPRQKEIGPHNIIPNSARYLFFICKMCTHKQFTCYAKKAIYCYQSKQTSGWMGGYLCARKHKLECERKIERAWVSECVRSWGRNKIFREHWQK